MMAHNFKIIWGPSGACLPEVVTPLLFNFTSEFELGPFFLPQFHKVPIFGEIFVKLAFSKRSVQILKFLLSFTSFHGFFKKFLRLFFSSRILFPCFFRASKIFPDLPQFCLRFTNPFWPLPRLLGFLHFLNLHEFLQYLKIFLTEE